MSTPTSRRASSSGGIAQHESRLIEPATSYNVFRIQRDIRGSSNIGAIATGVVREKADDAFTGGFDYNLRWNRNRDSVSGHWVVTHAPGEDGTKNGFGGVANVNVNRKHFNGNAHFDHFDTDFRINDLGFLRTRTNRNRTDGGIEIGQPDPGTHLRQYWFGLNGGRAWNDQGLVFEKNFETYFAYQFLNFWRGHFGTGGNMERLDDRDTRGGPPIVVPVGSLRVHPLRERLAQDLAVELQLRRRREPCRLVLHQLVHRHQLPAVVAHAGVGVDRHTTAAATMRSGSSTATMTATASPTTHTAR